MDLGAIDAEIAAANAVVEKVAAILKEAKTKKWPARKSRRIIVEATILLEEARRARAWLIDARNLVEHFDKKCDTAPNSEPS